MLIWYLRELLANLEVYLYKQIKQNMAAIKIFVFDLIALLYVQNSKRAGRYHTGPSAKLQVGFVAPRHTFPTIHVLQTHQALLLVGQK